MIYSFNCFCKRYADADQCSSSNFINCTYITEVPIKITKVSYLISHLTPSPHNPLPHPHHLHAKCYCKKKRVKSKGPQGPVVFK